MLLSLTVTVLSFLSSKADEPIIIDEDHPILNDPEALQAMEIFMGMSPEERKDAVMGLMEAVGDDPVAKAEMGLIISRLPALDAEQVKNSPGGLQSTLKQMIADDEFAKARRDARQQLGGVSWDFFVENHKAILEATIEGGQLSPEDVERFKNDENEWMKQLRIIYEDVAKKQDL
jgi:hypothetical protein